MSHVNPPATGSVAKVTRRERAKATRRRIAEAALGRFSEHGYAATTMDAIAHDAGVAVQTVYFTFHTKAELLIAALTIAGGGPGAAEDVLARDWIAEVIDAPTGPRRLALIVEHGNEIYRRIGPLLPAVQSAASVDPDVALAWQGLIDRRRDGMQRIVEGGVRATRRAAGRAGSGACARPVVWPPSRRGLRTPSPSNAAGPSNASRRGSS